MPRRRHHKAEHLSSEAQAIIESGLIGSGATYEQIAERVKAETGETISPASLGRYHQAKVRPRQEAKAYTAELARELAAKFQGGVSDSELMRAITVRATELLLPMMQVLSEEKPDAMASFLSDMHKRRLEELRLHQREDELELRAKQLEHQRALAERKLAEIAKKLESANEKKGGRAPTRAELEQTLRDLYGIARPAATEVAA